MAVEYRLYILPVEWGSADLYTFYFCVRHARSNTLPYHAKFKLGEPNERMYVDRIIQTDSHATIMVQEIRSESLLCIFSGDIYDFSSQISPLLWSSKNSEKFLMLIGYFLLLYTERYSFGATPYVFLNNLLKYSGLLIPTE